MRRSAATDELYDLQGGTLANFSFFPILTAHDGLIQLHRHARKVDTQPRQQGSHALARGHGLKLSVYDNLYVFCSGDHSLQLKTANEKSTVKLAARGRISL
jgi:hypothetical protein